MVRQSRLLAVIRGNLLLIAVKKIFCAEYRDFRAHNWNKSIIYRSFSSVILISTAALARCKLAQASASRFNGLSMQANHPVPMKIGSTSEMELGLLHDSTTAGLP
jgi:hypothetical protein